MKKCILTFFISSSLIFSSCVGYSTPTGLIKSPVVNASENDHKDTKAIVQKFLPENSVLLAQNDLVSGKSISSIDLDNDKAEELVAFFKMQDSYEKGFIILKKINNNWSKIFEKHQECSSISKFDFINIVDKNSKSLLIGCFIGGNSGSQYYSYTIKDGRVKALNLGWWKKFEILNVPSENNKWFTFAGMSRGIGDVENWDVIKLNNGELCHDETSYPSYAPKIIEYYNGLLQQYKSKDSFSALGVLAYYNLINAQIEGNVPEEALQSLDNFSKINNMNNDSFKLVPQSKFKFLQAKALNKSKRYEEAKVILDDLQAQYENDLSNLNAEKSDKSLNLIKNSKLDLLNIYFEKFKACTALDQKENISEIKDNVLKLNILEDYNKDEDDEITYNVLEINTAKEKLSILKQ